MLCEKKKNNRIAARLTIFLLSFLMLVCGTFPMGINSVYAANTTVATWEELVSAVNSASDGDTITLTANLGATDQIIIEKDITIIGGGNTIYRDYNGTALSNIDAMFKVKGGTLTLGDGLTLSGKVLRSDAGREGVVDDWTYRKNHIKTGTRGFFVEVGESGSLVIDGTTIKEYRTPDSTADNRDNLPTGISPLYVQGNFEMRSGSIEDNSVSAVSQNSFINNACVINGAAANNYIFNNGVLKHRVNSYDNVVWLSNYAVADLGAGAIYFDGADAKMVISGGEIKNNNGNAGAIIVNKGTLDIKNGTTISGNFGDHTSTIFVASDDATVRLCGGTIKDNVGNMGGGVLAGDNGRFFLMGGTIDNNYTPTSGGGILVYSNNVFILSGKITNNKSAVFGGGIYVYGDDDNRANSYTLVISKANVKNNTAVFTPDRNADANSKVKGIYTADNKSALTIIGEEAFQMGSGGGIWLCPAGIASFDATSVNLSGNTAERQNDDFHKDAGFKGGLLVDFEPHAHLSDLVHDEYTARTSGTVESFTVEEATSGMSEMFGIKNKAGVDYNDDVWVDITGNASRRGGGVGSNGTVLFMTPNHEDVNIDNGSLKYKKTFVDMEEEAMEYDMILADKNGDPVLNDKGDEIRIATFRLFDQDFADAYETRRKTKGDDLYGQGAAEWADDLSEIELTFPKGNDEANFFTTDSTDSAEMHIVMREYRVNPDNSRGAEVGERIFKSSNPEFVEAVEKDPQNITYYPNYVPCTSGQGCDSCDPGEPNTFKVVSRNFSFDANGINRETPEIEKYVDEAVHKDIEIKDTFTYNILAYVTTDADEMIITDELNDQLEFVSSAGDVKVYDLGIEKDTNLPINSNHLPVYDISGKEINNGDKIPSVRTGAAIDIKDNDFSKVEISGNSLKIKIANKLVKNEQGEYINADDDQELTPLQGHYVRVEFKAKLSKDVREELYITKSEESLVYETIMDDRDYEDGISGQRGIPYTGNDPVKSDENHTGIANTASYEIKVKNEAKYQDTSNTVTVRPDLPQKPDEPEGGGETNPDNEEPDDIADAGEKESAKIKSANTGDETPLGFAFFGLLGSAAAFELMRRRRMS